MTWLGPLPIAHAMFAVMLLAGLALFVAGLRGRRVSDHPYCRRCGFDLYGLDAHSELCPECGTDRHAPRAVRMGKRKRRPALVMIGGVLTLASMTIMGTILWAGAVQFDWNTVKPAWMLLREARSNDALMRDAPLSELLARNSAGTLRANARNAVITILLDIQADTAAPWRNEWGDIVYRTYVDGDVDDAMFRRFLEQALVFELDFRTPVRAESDIEVWLRYQGRGAIVSGFFVKLVRESFVIGDIEYARHLAGYTRTGFADTGASGNFIRLANAPGEYPVHGRWRVSVTREDAEVELHEWTLEMNSRMEITDETGDVISMVADAELEDEIRKGVSLAGASVQNPDEKGRRHVQMTVNLRDLPVNVAFDVYWRIGDREWFIGRAALAAAKHHGFGQHMLLEGLPEKVGEVTVVLRASAEAARRTTDLTEIWNGELIFENVPVGGMPPFPAR